MGDPFGPWKASDDAGQEFLIEAIPAASGAVQGTSASFKIGITGYRTTTGDKLIRESKGVFKRELDGTVIRSSDPHCP